MRLNWGTAPISVFDLFEIFLTLLCLAMAFATPDAGRHWFSRIERALCGLSRRPWLCAAILFTLPILLRLLLVPVYGAPLPFISDEYAYLLQSDTFAAGRLTNPSPPLPQHFASVYVLAEPSYAAEYQVGQGLVLALGQVLTGWPWTGVMLSMGAMCALIYWALLAWLPPQWAFCGTLVVIDIQLGVLSYWMNSYWGGCAPAIGGALALGALARLRASRRVLFSFLLAAGLIVLMNSRPLEGVFLTILAVGALAYWIFVSKELSLRALVRQVLPSLAFMFAVAAASAGYYNQRVTGAALEFPYLLYRGEYGLPQGFFWQKPVRATLELPSDIRAEFEDQMRQHERRTSLKALLGATGGKLRRLWEFYIGIPLTPVLVFLPFIWSRRTVPGMALAGWALTLVVGADNMLFFAYFPHYSAAVTVVLALVLVQCLREMRPTGAAGLFLSRALPVVCLIGLLLPMCGRLVEAVVPSQLAAVKRLWQSEFLHEVSREAFVPRLEREPGKQLVLVRYEPYNGARKTEWIFNRADLQNAKIVWARDAQDAQALRELTRQFPGRKVWLAEPDAKPPRVGPYPLNLGN